MNLLLLYRIKCLPKNTNGRLAIPALAGLLVIFVLKLSQDFQQRVSIKLLIGHFNQLSKSNIDIHSSYFNGAGKRIKVQSFIFSYNRPTLYNVTSLVSRDVVAK